MIDDFYSKLIVWMCLQVSGVTLSASAQPVIFDRVYSKVESGSGEHCSGWTVELWKTGTSFVGMLDHHRGLCGDPPTGILKDLRLDPSSGRISFTVKISDTSDGFGKFSCDSLTFEGRLTDEKLIGEMKWQGTGISGHSEFVDLDRVKAERYGKREYDNIANWEKSCADVLKFRGPRC